MKKGKILSLLCAVALLVGGFVVAQNINFSTVGKPVQKLVSTNKPASANTSTNISYNESQSTSQQMFVYDVILVDFNNATCIDGRLNKTLDNYIETYNKVSDYLYELSGYKATFYFNFYNYKLDMNSNDLTHSNNKMPSNFASVYDEIIENKTTLKHTYGEGITILQFASLYSVQFSQFAWPSWFNFEDINCQLKYAIRIIDETPYTTISHELLHSLGLPDLYSDYNKECSLNYDIMSSYFTNPAILNAYHKKTLNWIEESNNNDSKITEIENIDQDGNYRLYYPENKNKTIAYSFGQKEQEVFYIEARNVSENQVLVVNRVNKCIDQGNVCAENLSECLIAEVANIQRYSNKVISKNGEEKLKNVVYYSSGEIANFAIGSVEFYDNYLDFNFSTTGDFKFETQINVVDDKNSPLTNAFVYVNDNYVGTTNLFGQFSCSVAKDDKITVLNPETKNPLTHFVKDAEKNIKIVFESEKKVVQQNDKNEKVENNDIQSFILYLSVSQKIESSSADLNYFYLDQQSFNKSTKIRVYVDNNLVENTYSRTCVVDLKNNSQLRICVSNLTFTYIYDSASKTLRDTSSYVRTYSQNNTFSLNLAIPTIKYTFCLFYDDNLNKKAGIKHVKAFNGVDGTWETLTCISGASEYSPMPVYLTADYTNVEIEYQNWYEWNTVSYEINPTRTEYYTILSENIIQSGLDWWSDLLGF